MPDKDLLTPFNDEAEKIVIGSIIVNPDMIAEVIEILKPEAFYSPNHQKIYEAILKLFDKSEPIDNVSVSNELHKNKVLDSIGGRAYINDLVLSIVTTANAGYYAKLVHDDYSIRQLIKTCNAVKDQACSGESKEEIFNKAQDLFLSLSQTTGKAKIKPLKDFILDVYSDIQGRYENKDQLSGLPSGFYDLDEQTGGFQPSDLIIIAARPSMGKTALCLDMASYIGAQLNLPVAIFSLEMSKEQLTQRLISTDSEVSTLLMRTGNLDCGHFSKITNSLEKLSNSKIFIDDSPGVSISEIRAKCKQLQHTEQLRLVIVDYLQLMEGAEGKDGRVQEISKISRGLKKLARELSCPVIALSQLSRAVEQRQNKRPMLSDLRESGAIEQDADTVLFIYRHEYYEPEDESAKGKAEIIIAKQRNGPTGMTELHFDGRLTHFKNQVKQPEVKQGRLYG